MGNGCRIHWMTNVLLLFSRDLHQLYCGCLMLPVLQNCQTVIPDPQRSRAYLNCLVDKSPVYKLQTCCKQHIEQSISLQTEWNCLLHSLRKHRACILRDRVVHWKWCGAGDLACGRVALHICLPTGMHIHSVMYKTQHQSVFAPLFYYAATYLLTCFCYFKQWYLNW